VTKLLLVGCGKMGQALASGWLARGIPPKDIAVIEPNGIPEEAGLPALKVYPDLAALPAAFKPGVVLLAIKPQVLPTALPDYARFAGALFISIAAGKPLAFFAHHLGQDTQVIRAMPNTPAAIGQGITVCVANTHVDQGARDIGTRLLQAVGKVEWIEDEGLMDAVTAVSGSGPAYVFLLAEVMEAAGIRAGLPEALARTLARSTVTGAGNLLAQSDLSATQLRNNVTSPGGTTAAALEVLMYEQRGLADLMRDAVAAAVRRGKELASQG
jgi:pyrroline-5-carboxylate reductase